MAEVIPFPLIKRRVFIAKHAARALDLPHKTAEKHIAHTLNVQREVMQRRGVDGDRIDAEISAAEVAIRATMARFLVQPGGAA